MTSIKRDSLALLFRRINPWRGSSMRKRESLMCLYDIFPGVGCMPNLKIDSWSKYHFFFWIRQHYCIFITFVTRSLKTNRQTQYPNQSYRNIRYAISTTLSSLSKVEMTRSIKCLFDISQCGNKFRLGSRDIITV